MKVKPLYLKVFLLFLSISLNKAYGQSTIDCSKAKTQAEIDLCAQSQFAATDKALNIIYKKVSDKLDVQQRITLVQSQRKWISFRDEYCKVYGLIYKGGSMAPSAILKCKTEATRSRIAELQVLFNQVDL